MGRAPLLNDYSIGETGLDVKFSNSKTEYPH